MQIRNSDLLKSFVKDNNLDKRLEADLKQEEFNDLFKDLSKRLYSKFKVTLKNRTFFAKKESTKDQFKAMLTNLLHPHGLDDPHDAIMVPSVFVDIIYAVNDKDDTQELIRIFYTPANSKYRVVTSDFFDLTDDLNSSGKLISNDFRKNLLIEIINLLDQRSVIQTLDLIGRYGAVDNQHNFIDTPLSGSTY